MPKGVYPRTESIRKILSDAHRGKPSPKRGIKLSEDLRKKISAGHKGQTPWILGKHHTPESRRKMSAAHKGVHLSDAHRESISHAARPRMSDETKRKIAETKIGDRNPMKRPDVRKKNSESNKGRISPRKGVILSETTKEKLRRITGEHTSNWKGGISFEPYCPKFNNEFKERVRAFFKQTCQCCGHVWQNGEPKLSVHHIGYDKEACCNGRKPLFVPVCGGCHSKTNHNREYWEDILTKKILLEYDGDCYLPKVPA